MTLGGFTFPMPCSTHVHHTSYGTTTGAVPTTRRTTHVTMTVTVHKSMQFSAGSKGLTDGVNASSSKETISREVTHTSDGVVNSPSIIHTAPSLQTDRYSQPMTYTTFWTPQIGTSSQPVSPTASGTMDSLTSHDPLRNNISAILGITLAATLLMIIAISCFLYFLWPRHQLRKAQRGTVRSEQKWWDWIKMDRKKPWTSTRGLDLTELAPFHHLSSPSPALFGIYGGISSTASTQPPPVHHLRSTSPAVFGAHDETTVATPLHNSAATATTLKSWSLRSAPAVSEPGPIRFPFRNSRQYLSLSSESLAATTGSNRSHGTAEGDSGVNAYAHKDPKNPYAPFGYDVSPKIPSVAKAYLYPPPTRGLVITQDSGRPVSEVASLGTDSDESGNFAIGSDSDDEFEDVKFR